MKTIISCAGGKIANSIARNPNCLIISCPEDSLEYKTYLNKAHKVYGVEFVMFAVMRQEIDYESSLLK